MPENWTNLYATLYAKKWGSAEPVEPVFCNSDILFYLFDVSLQKK